jgi:hypothetical protein
MYIQDVKKTESFNGVGTHSNEQKQVPRNIRGMSINQCLLIQVYGPVSVWVVILGDHLFRTS